ncbi:hypothetical protein LCGC14_2904250 [marine sediment metagenome]|uniref:Uncharacterized protein n=1 Tax=marine sediment metagenome TaxID=412755 RepID=A0A0F8YFG1_9ZZZZ
MKIFFYTEQIPIKRVRGEPCCTGMKLHWESAEITARHTGVVINTHSGLGYFTGKDMYFTHCPWCGTKVTIHIERDYDSA